MTPKPLVKSKCCNAELKTWTSDDGTSFFVCTACDKATDPSETNEANSVMISAEIVKLMLEDAKLEERQRVVETLKKIGIVDEETGTITFSYNELFDSLEPK